MSYLIVSPSVRPFPPEWYDSVKDETILIVDDSDGKADRSGLSQIPHLVYADTTFTEKYLGDSPIKSIIPRHNPSCKDFGLWYAWKEKYDVVVLLDDDCDTRISPHFLEEIPVGKSVTAAGYNTQSGWINPCQCLDGRFVSRGVPYEYRLEVQEFYDRKPVSSSFNEGMWWGTPDINGIDKLNMDPTFEHPELLLIAEGTPLSLQYSYLLKGQHLPLSIMNVQLKRELIPAFYQPPDYQVWNGFKVRRHDDVWSAYFLKTIMDFTGDVMTFGAPLIYHRKAGNAVREVLSEHHANLIQPYLNATLDEAGRLLTGLETDYVQLAQRLADNARSLVLHNPNTPRLYAGILAKYFDNCSMWADCCGSI